MLAKVSVTVILEQNFFIIIVFCAMIPQIVWLFVEGRAIIVLFMHIIFRPTIFAWQIKRFTLKEGAETCLETRIS